MKNNSEILKLAHQIRRETGCDLKTAFQQAYKQADTAVSPSYYTKEDLNRMFTAKVQSYFKKGYILNPLTMGGSQGEIAKVDVTNGNEVIRIQMVNDRFRQGCYVYDTLVCIRVGRVTVEEKPNLLSCETIWDNELTTLSSFEVVQLRPGFYTTPELSIKMSKKGLERWRVKQTPDKMSFLDTERVYKVALKWVRKQKGYKTAKLSDITKVYKCTPRSSAPYYVVTCKGRNLTWK